MNSLLENMKEINNRKIGENGDYSYCSTLNGLMRGTSMEEIFKTIKGN